MRLSFLYIIAYADVLFNGFKALSWQKGGISGVINPGGIVLQEYVLVKIWKYAR